jgi:pseudouridine-5'-phosphate glycosidase
MRVEVSFEDSVVGVFDPTVASHEPPYDSPMAFRVRVSPVVTAALADGQPVVALESTVFSRLGLPGPAGAEARKRVYEAVQASGATPAMTVVLDGEARVGVDDEELPQVLAADRKVGERDLPVAVAQRWPAAATTVSASVALAAGAGIGVFATGGIGGVHRDWPETGDESADLAAIARHPVVTVCAGAKSFLDLPRTLERLETLGVPVIGFATSGGGFPAFWSRRSGLPVPHEVATADEAAGVVQAARALGYGGGLLVVTPVPEAEEVPFEELAPIIEATLADAASAGIRGGAVTPFVIERIATATGGRTVAANLALVEHNAAVAAAIAGALARTP